MNEPAEDADMVWERAISTMCERVKNDLPRPGPANELYYRRTLAMLENIRFDLIARSPYSHLKF